jgi:hypothetical protein
MFHADLRYPDLCTLCYADLEHGESLWVPTIGKEPPASSYPDTLNATNINFVSGKEVLALVLMFQTSRS